MNTFDLIRFDHNLQRFVLKDTQAPANAFEWRRYVVEEAIRRGDKPAKDPGSTSRKRSIATTKSLERIRETQPNYGTLNFSKKTAAMIAMKPKTFTIYSRAQSKGQGSI